MKKLPASDLIPAILAVIGIPLLLLLQQKLMPDKLPPYPQDRLFKANIPLMAATEKGLEYGADKAHFVAQAASIYMAGGDMLRAESWLKQGAIEFGYPSLQLFYGDFLLRQKRFREASGFLHLALRAGQQAGNRYFVMQTAKKLQELKRLAAQSAGGKK